MDNGQQFKAEVECAAEILDDKRREESRKKFRRNYGVYSEKIFEEGDGGGYTAIPHALDIYQDALGLSIKEAWYLKIIMRYLPDIRPSMAKIADRTGQSEATLSAIKKGLVEKGFIIDGGAVNADGGQMQKRLNIMPLFDAVFLCMACDANSKLTKYQAYNRERTAFAAWIGEDEEDERAADYQSSEDYRFTEFPLSIETAKAFAKAKGLTLNWERLEAMQGKAERQNLADLKADRMRELLLKNAIKAGGMELRIYPNIYREWFLPLCRLPITADELEGLTRAYVEQADTVNAKEYRKWITEVLDSPKNRQIMAERPVYFAMAEAEQVLAEVG